MKDIYDKIFNLLELDDDKINIIGFINNLESKGIYKIDPRLKEMKSKIDKNKKKIFYDRDEFYTLISDNVVIIDKILKDDFVIPNFKNFTDSIKTIYTDCKENTNGNKADYIPQLKKQNDNHFGVSICTVDGQQYNIGDTRVEFCIQSCCKPINYCIALESNTVDFVHEYVGREPSGEQFNALKLNEKGIPHNPLINSGAIMTCSLIGREMNQSNRFDYITDIWGKLSGNKKVGYSNSVYLSEKNNANRNFALAYFMNENKGFPKGTNMMDILEFYFQCCSLTITSNQLSIVAATLANGGVNPITGIRIFSDTTVRNCLSMMYSCGMYNYSGEFAFEIGLPAKSGVAGGIFIVIPNVMGICTFSPKLDKYGNSVRGIEFCKSLVNKYSFHNFDSLLNSNKKEDPRMSYSHKIDIRDIIDICAIGDLSALKYIQLNDINLDKGDYDGRTPLHLACSNGHINIVKYLVETFKIKQLSPTDRWGNTPIDDAKRDGHTNIIEYLNKQ